MQITELMALAVKVLTDLGTYCLRDENRNLLTIPTNHSGMKFVGVSGCTSTGGVVDTDGFEIVLPEDCQRSCEAFLSRVIQAIAEAQGGSGTPAPTPKPNPYTPPPTPPGVAGAGEAFNIPEAMLAVVVAIAVEHLAKVLLLKLGNTQGKVNFMATFVSILTSIALITPLMLAATSSNAGQLAPQITALAVQYVIDPVLSLGKLQAKEAIQKLDSIALFLILNKLTAENMCPPMLALLLAQISLEQQGGIFEAIYDHWGKLSPEELLRGLQEKLKELGLKIKDNKAKAFASLLFPTGLLMAHQFVDAEKMNESQVNIDPLLAMWYLRTMIGSWKCLNSYDPRKCHKKFEKAGGAGSGQKIPLTKEELSKCLSKVEDGHNESLEDGLMPDPTPEKVLERIAEKLNTIGPGGIFDNTDGVAGISINEGKEKEAENLKLLAQSLIKLGNETDNIIEEVGLSPDTDERKEILEKLIECFITADPKNKLDLKATKANIEDIIEKAHSNGVEYKSRTLDELFQETTIRQIAEAAAGVAIAAATTSSLAREGGECTGAGGESSTTWATACFAALAKATKDAAAHVRFA
jgi:hypothetical protein